VALQAAANTAGRVLLPARQSWTPSSSAETSQRCSVAADPRLTALLARAEPRVLDIPEPRRTVLNEAAHRARCVEVQLRP
jgi:hypothetical protein